MRTQQIVPCEQIDRLVHISSFWYTGGTLCYFFLFKTGQKLE